MRAPFALLLAACQAVETSFPPDGARDRADAATDAAAEAGASEAALCVDPEEIVFDVEYGESAEREVEVRNCGARPIEVRSIAVTSRTPFADLFSVDAPGTPLSLAPGEGLVARVTFTALGQGGRVPIEALRIEWDGPDSPTHVHITGVVRGCPEGKFDADGNAANGCETPCRGAERCDGLDDDCDGAADEDFDVGRPCDGPDADECTEGVTLCAPDGTDVVCGDTTDDSVERCDGLDNDCDGAADEGILVGAPCDGPDEDLCAEGETVCALDGEVACSDDPDEHDFELCDGVDNDCDGFADEDVVVCAGECCLPGQSCFLGACCTPACAGRECGDDACGGVCGECDAPAAPACDGDLCVCPAGLVCDGTCCGGGEVCAGGDGPCCAPAPLDDCDGGDENCSGEEDEGCGECTGGDAVTNGSFESGLGTGWQVTYSGDTLSWSRASAAAGTVPHGTSFLRAFAPNPTTDMTLQLEVEQSTLALTGGVEYELCAFARRQGGGVTSQTAQVTLASVPFTLVGQWSFPLGPDWQGDCARFTPALTGTYRVRFVTLVPGTTSAEFHYDRIRASECPL